MSYIRINKRKYHFIYKTTCSLTGRYYIGMHSTDNLEDGYIGSGRLLCYSIRKYGKENHVREILEFCSSREELASREAEIVNLNEIAKSECMNLKLGGCGGICSKDHFEKFQSAGVLASIKKMKELRNDDIWVSKYSKSMSIALKKSYKEGRKSAVTFSGKKHSEETKLKMSMVDRTGKKNSQYGTCWITNGSENRKIKKEDKIPDGWSKGRKFKN
jgi:hypothetical protein